MELYEKPHSIFLMFAEPVVGNTIKSFITTKLQDIWNGHLFTHHLKHVELVVSIGDELYAYRGIGDTYDKKGNIVEFGGVKRIPNKSYKRDEYVAWIEIHVSRGHFDDCVEFCEEIVNNPKTRYDDDFGIRQLLPSCTPKQKHTWSCSDFVCSALQCANVLPEEWESSVTTSQQIFNYLYATCGMPFVTELPFLKGKMNYE